MRLDVRLIAADVWAWVLRRLRVIERQHPETPTTSRRSALSNRSAGWNVPRSVRCLLLVSLSCGLVAAGCGGGGSLGANALSKEADNLQSLSAEGALLAGDAAAGKTTAIYTQQHATELRAAARNTAESLTKATAAPGLRSSLRELRRLASRVTVELGRLGSASRSEQARIARELGKAAKQSEKIGQGLQ